MQQRLLHRLTTPRPKWSRRVGPRAYLLLHLCIHASLACHHKLLDHLRGHLATHIQDRLPEGTTSTQTQQGVAVGLRV